MSILEKLGFKKRTHVGISISANSFIELVCIDKTTKSVVKYSSDNVKYNNSIREIVDYDELTESIEGLFEDVGLNPKECSVTLSLPNVHFGITPLDSASETPFIVENIQSDIEDLYVFKRNEPAISYSIMENGITKGQKNIVFSAIQTKVAGRLLEIFDKMECDLVRIDNAYSSMFRAIQYCDRFSKYVSPEERTLIILVTSNSCSAFFMSGNIVTDVIEEPLAVKSFSSEEVYSAVSKLATNSILKNSPKSLLVISETDEVDASMLAQRVEFAGDVDCINKSINNNEQFIEVYGLDSDIDSNMISYMTIEAVGAAAADYDEYPLDINFVPKERVRSNIVEAGVYEVPFDRYLIFVILAAALAAFIIAFAVNGLCQIGIDFKRRSNADTKMNIEIFRKSLDKNSVANLDVLPVMTKIVNKNRAIMDAYVSIAEDIPDTAYIKKFVVSASGGIGILGEAKTSESVQVFIDHLKERNNILMLTKLSVNSQNDSINSKIPDGYTFEIKSPDSDISFEMPGIDRILAPNDRDQRSFRFYNPLQPPPSPII